MSHQKIFTGKSYRDGNKFVKEVANQGHLTKEWGYHYEAFQEQYPIVPRLLDFIPEKLVVTEYVEGVHIMGSIPTRKDIEDIFNMVHCFSSYSAENDIDFYHGDICETNLLKTDSGLKLIDVDSIFINNKYQMNKCIQSAYGVISRYVVSSMRYK